MAPSNAKYRSQVKRAVFARYPDLVDWWNGTEWVREHPRQRVRRAA
jgi:hypothetical protein